MNPVGVVSCRVKTKSDEVVTVVVVQGKLIGEKFKALSSEEREKYDELAKKDKARYERDMAAYQEKQKAEKEAEESDGVDEDQDDSDDSD
jgi:hypothetical protein